VGIQHLLEMICFLLNNWLQVVASGSEREASNFPARVVEEAMSKFLLTNIPNDTLGTISRLESIRQRICRRFS
jgi:hypothetical protein